MKKITQLEFGAMTHQQTWNHINSIQSELEALEGRKGQSGQGAMTVEEITKWIIDTDEYPFSVGMMKHHEIVEMAKYIQPLTVPQGFVVDWSDAPKESKGVSIRFVDYDEEYWNDLVADWNIQYIPRPLPPKVTRERTREEKIHALKSYLQTPVVKMFERMNDTTLDDLCRAAGISLTSE